MKLFFQKLFVTALAIVGALLILAIGVPIILAFCAIIILGAVLYGVGFLFVFLYFVFTGPPVGEKEEK